MLAEFQGDRGKANPMLTIAAIRPWVRWITSATLWAFKWLPLRNLRRLRFIHFARWVVLKRSDFRVADPNYPKENLNYNYLMFSTNFNNQWEQYIDAFSMVVPLGVNFLWATCRRFPCAWPIRLFKIYIRYNEYPIDYYYNAYPEASVRDIESAIDVDRLLAQFMTLSRDLDPDTFAKEYQVFIRSIQNKLESGRPDKEIGDWPVYRHIQPINLTTL